MSFIVLSTWRSQTPIVKLQVITLAAKLLVLAPMHSTIILLARYVFMLARYDVNYDVRDRGRVLSALILGVSPQVWNGRQEEVQQRGGVVLRREQVKVVLFHGKAGIVEKDEWGGRLRVIHQNLIGFDRCHRR